MMLGLHVVICSFELNQVSKCGGKICFSFSQLKIMRKIWTICTTWKVIQPLGKQNCYRALLICLTFLALLQKQKSDGESWMCVSLTFAINSWEDLHVLAVLCAFESIIQTAS